MNNKDMEQSINEAINKTVLHHLGRLDDSINKLEQSIQQTSARVQPVVLTDATKVNDTNGVARSALYNVYSSPGGGGSSTKAPVMTTVDTIDCTDTVTSNVVDDKQVVYTKPDANSVQTVKFCPSTEMYDYEIVCSSIDARLLVLKLDVTGVNAPVLTEIDGSALIDASTAVKCSGGDYEYVESCYQDITTPSIKYSQLNWFVSTDLQTVVATTWLDDLGNVITAPSNIERCTSVEQPVPYDWACANRNCRVQNFTFSFDDTQFISQEIISSTGSGQQYTGQYIFATPADALSFYQMYSLMALPGARANAAGFLNYHPGFFVSGSYDNNVTVEVIFDISNTVAAQDAATMCGFIEPAGEYSNTAIFLASFWDPIVGAGPQLGGSFSIDVELYTGGNTPLQLLKYVDPTTGEVRDRALIYMPGFPDHLTEYTPALGETVAAGLCPLAPTPAPEILERPNGIIITNTGQLSVMAGVAAIQSFSVKGLAGKTYDISFDGGVTWNVGIDGGDSWGEGNIELINVNDVFIRPTVTGETVFVHWEVR